MSWKAPSEVEPIVYTYGRRYGLVLPGPTSPVTGAHQIYLPLVARNHDPQHIGQPFAVVATSAGFRAGYDRNGNMLVRVEISGTEPITYTQAWDVENRLNIVTNTVTGEVTRFTYDGDGTRALRDDANGVTVYLGAMEVHITGTQRLTTTYYFAGGQRIAMREGIAVTYLHGDHLGSASLATDESGGLVSEMRYTPNGVTRSGDMPTAQRFTDQRWESGLGLYDYGARFYSPSLGRFISADTIVPDLGNPQSFNRYAYVLGNPLKYTDPNGHATWLPFALVFGAVYLGGRVAYEAASVVFVDSDRRDQIGGQLAIDVSEAIQSESASHSVDSILVGAVLRHESAAFERRLLTLWPSMQPGLIANTAEFAQSAIQGDMASIGPGQMQLQRARELEEMGYVTMRKNDYQRRLALLGKDTAVEYVAGMLHYLSDQLNRLEGYVDLDLEQQQRLLLIAYNWGWTTDFLEVIRKHGWEGIIDLSKYDNETLDEYLRWMGEQ